MMDLQTGVGGEGGGGGGGRGKTEKTLIEKKKLSFSVASLLENKFMAAAIHRDHHHVGDQDHHVDDHEDDHDYMHDESRDEDEDVSVDSDCDDIDPGHEDRDGAVSPPSLPRHPLAYPHPLLSLRQDAGNHQPKFFNIFPPGMNAFNQAMFRSGTFLHPTPLFYPLYCASFPPFPYPQPHTFILFS